MTSSKGLAERIATYRASKAVVGWCCAFSVVATIVVGFAWGGWVTGGSAAAMANSAAEGAQTKLAAAICAAQFNGSPDAAVQLAALNKLDHWDRADFIKKGGWASLPGLKDPVSGAADLCAEQLTAAKST
jgi:hypothetical protein